MNEDKALSNTSLKKAYCKPSITNYGLITQVVKGNGTIQVDGCGTQDDGNDTNPPSCTE